MIDWVFANSGYIVLVGFFSAFCWIIWWAYRPSNRAALEQLREIPFRDGE